MMNEISAHHIATQQEKLDAIFGITGGKSVDEFLDGLSLETNEIQDTVLSIEQSLKDQMDVIDQCQTSIQSNQSNDVLLDISTMNKSLKEVEDLIQMSKDVIQHVANGILATPLIDSEAVQAYSKLLESIHINIAEFISMYKDKQNFLNKIKFAVFTQQQKKDLLLYKHNLEIEKLKLKNGPESIEADSVQTRTWKQEDITRFLNESQNDVGLSC